MNFINITNKVKTITLGTNEEVSLQRKLYLLINLITILISSIGLISNLIQGMNLWSSVVIIISIIVVLSFYIYARNNNKKELLLIPLFISSLVLLTIGWFTNGGYDGSIISLMFIFFIAIYFLVKKKHRLLVFVSYLILYSVLVLTQYYNPKIVIPYDNSEQRLVDILIGGVLYMFLLYAFISIITRSYESENKKVVIINEQLKRQNKEIADNIKNLEISEEKFSKAFNICPVAISIAPIADGRYIEVNDAFLKISGFEREEVIGHTFDELNFYLDNSDRQRLIDELLKNGFLRNFEFQFRMKNGDIRDSLVSSDIIEIEGQKCSLNFLTDITERKHADEKIKKSEESLNEAQNIAKMGSWEFDLINNKTIWSDNYYKIYGINSIEIEPNQELFRKKVHPDDRHLIDEGFQLIQKTKSTLKIEMRIILEDNSVKWIQNIIVPVFENDKLIALKGINLDITERKQAEKELLESETKFRAIFENSRDAISVSKNGTRVFGNSSLIKMFGYNSLEEIIGKSIFESIAPSHHQQMIQKVQDVTLGIPTPSFYESKGIKRDGTEFDIEISGSNYYLNGEQFTVGMIRDISERKKVESAIMESEKKYKTLFESNTDGITIFALRENEPPSSILDMNPRAYLMLGYTKEEMLLMKPDDIEKDITWDKIEKRIIDLNTKGFSEFETILKHKNGYDVFVEIKVMIIDYNNQPALMNIVRDISGRRIAENAFRSSELLNRTVISNAPLVTFVTDDKGIFTLSEGKALEKLGLNPGQVVGLSVFDVYKDYQEILESMMKALEGESQRKEIKVQNVVFDVYFSPVFDQYGKVTQVVGVSNDITERKHAEELLKEQNLQLERQYEEYMQLNEVLRATNYDLENAKEKAEESDKLKTAFLQNMSHEIRTPLNGILGFSNLLQDENLQKEEINDYTAVIQQSCNRLLEIVNNVLDISKIETGQISIARKEFLIDSVFSDILTFFTPVAESKKLILSCPNLKDTKRKIYSDESKLMQILSNLINNSLKFTSAGRIDYGYEIIDNDIQFFVKDTGIGISNEYFDKIFDRFTQVDLKITRGYEGAGLGLAICKGLVELLGGKIWLESEVGIGTTFYFTVPLIETGTGSNDDSQETTSKMNLSFGKILIAEDDWASFQYISRILAKTEISILHAENGEKAVELVKAIPDLRLVLMDIKMPIMNGIEATKLIKQIRPELPIIAQTAYAFSSEREEILSIGCNDYISKPISKANLLKVIEKYSK